MPQIQMKSYNLNAILLPVQHLGISYIHTEFIDHRGEQGVFILFYQVPSTMHANVCFYGKSDQQINNV